MSVMTTLRIVVNLKSLSPVAAKDFCLQKRADSLWVSASPPFSGYWGFFPESKVAGEWSWLLTSI